MPVHTSDAHIRQGNATSTVLTNRSKYITVISDESVESQKKSNIFSSSTNRNRHLKGTRPAHKTTLTFERQPADASFVTTSKDVFSGKKDLEFTRRPPRCPSLHLSQFQIGSGKHRDEGGQWDESLRPVNMSHEDKRRWRKEMEGSNMLNSLKYDCRRNSNSVPKMYFDTTESSQGNDYSPYPKATRVERYDIITGESSAGNQRDGFRKVSGNRILQCIRAQTEEGILG